MPSRNGLQLGDDLGAYVWRIKDHRMLTSGAQRCDEVQWIGCSEVCLHRFERVEGLIGHAAQMRAGARLDGNSRADSRLGLGLHDERKEIDVGLGRLGLLLGSDLNSALDARESKDPAGLAVVVVGNEIPPALSRDHTPGINPATSRRGCGSTSVIEGDNAAFAERCHERQQSCVSR